MSKAVKCSEPADFVIPGVSLADYYTGKLGCAEAQSKLILSKEIGGLKDPADLKPSGLDICYFRVKEAIIIGCANTVLLQGRERL